ncbi:hypothetical protein A2316_02560 [Candidatus Falkowbacteria bacterium RIFOXYB2_FULL_38_15]|uniref:Chloroplast import component protein (Tic20) n=1 Tax=Candidatus Falkowbacteria bacterium RIFOXYA2_FULL_38_12 TaxID=1797993 RepID=A0A1F5S207_9BACT|nr:MAG: hypothetical protein A2257_03110 [Candidatus Falkowbacteria bacterium RIFOXYA2_FULL_38_12]OGF32532.1 MAG: hypothetical protein A2316_02560 [Candidatus Falkowbacteria bacterium RIFOXYB2_FULL_38_15]OGF42002.1 MAG: hypothetical protein A2555_04070 [Candidatus Falkowbacteria bacterium RIFOXYD2_FULL_39_16]
MDEAINQNEPQKKDQKSQNTLMALLAYIVFFIPLLTDAKNDEFVKYHVKQGLGLFILSIVVGIINSTIPFYFWFIGTILWLGVLVFFVIGIMNALGEKKEPLPLIGKMAEKINI